MKKIIAIISSLALIATMSFSAIAATITEKDIMKQIESGVTINGVTVSIDESYVKLANDFLDSEEFTSEELSYLYDEGLAAKEVWVQPGATDISKMSKDVKDKIINITTKAANHVGVTLTISKESIQIISKSGKVFETATVKDPIKNTGAQADFSALAFFAGVITIALTGAVIIARKNSLSMVR